MKVSELTGHALDCAVANRSVLAQLRADRILNIDEPLSSIITGGSAYLTRSGQSVAITLHGPRDPRRPEDQPIAKHRVYLPLASVEAATEPRHLLNAATHKATRWLDEIRADYWFALVVIACRPMRDKCKSLLQAISKTARQHYGNKYWRHPESRALLRRELSLMGIQCPPDGPAIEYLFLANTRGSVTMDAHNRRYRDR